MAEAMLSNLNIPDWSDFGHFLPEAVLVVTFLLALVADMLTRRGRPWAPFVVALAGCVTAMVLAVQALGGGSHTILGDLVLVDGMAGFFRLLFIFVGAMTILFSWSSEEIMGRKREAKGEFFALTVLLTAGMAVMAEAADLVMLYLSMELVGLTSYVLAGYMRTSLRSTEASLKYLLFGAVSSGVMLYGLSLLYGLTGETTFEGIRLALAAGEANPFALLVVVILVLAGFGYKIAAVPFHFWCPDVYQGAPTPVSAFFSVGPKAAGFALMIRFFYTATVAGPGDQAAVFLSQVDWPLLIAVLSVATMTYGNCVALRQNNVKRLLAYSSIAHVGYLLMGFLLLTAPGLQAILFYLAVYALMNLGAFFFVVAVNNTLRSEELADYEGLAWRIPWPAGAAMVVFLVSLTGLPPTAGFIGKFYLFTEVLNQGYWWLAVVAALNSVISLFFYMKVAKAMYFGKPAEGAARVPLAMNHLIVLVALALPTFVLGIYWSPLKALADNAIAGFGG